MQIQATPHFGGKRFQKAKTRLATAAAILATAVGGTTMVSHNNNSNPVNSQQPSAQIFDSFMGGPAASVHPHDSYDNGNNQRLYPQQPHPEILTDSRSHMRDAADSLINNGPNPEILTDSRSDSASTNGDMHDAADSLINSDNSDSE